LVPVGRSGLAGDQFDQTLQAEKSKESTSETETQGTRRISLTWMKVKLAGNCKTNTYENPIKTNIPK
jgi:hypothetical protein